MEQKKDDKDAHSSAGNEAERPKLFKAALVAACGFALGCILAGGSITYHLLVYIPKRDAEVSATIKPQPRTEVASKDNLELEGQANLAAPEAVIVRNDETSAYVGKFPSTEPSPREDRRIRTTSPSSPRILPSYEEMSGVTLDEIRERIRARDAEQRAVLDARLNNVLGARPSDNLNRDVLADGASISTSLDSAAAAKTSAGELPIDAEIAQRQEAPEQQKMH